MSHVSASATQLSLIKLLLHAQKYPSAAVNGVLLGTISPAGAVSITDAVPLFHTVISLAPPVEIALAQLEAHTASPSSSVRLVGYYHAEARPAAADLNAIARRIADRISEHNPGAVALLLDTKKLSAYIKGSEPDGPFDLFSKADGSRSWKREASGTLLVEQDWTVLRETFLAAVQGQQYRDISDFDEHLDDVAVDYFNSKFKLGTTKFALPGQLA